MPKITRSKFFAIADRIAADPKGRGIRDVTYRAMAEALGGGSHTTIKKFMDEWRRYFADQASIPEELTNALHHLIDKVWIAARDEKAGAALPVTASNTLALPRRFKGVSGRVSLTLTVARAGRQTWAGGKYDALRAPVEKIIVTAQKPLFPMEIYHALTAAAPELIEQFDKHHFSRSLHNIKQRGSLTLLRDGRWAISSMSRRDRARRPKAPNYKPVDTPRAQRRRVVNEYADRALTLLRTTRKAMSADELFQRLIRRSAPPKLGADTTEVLTPMMMKKALYKRVYHQTAPITFSRGKFRYTAEKPNPLPAQS